MATLGQMIMEGLASAMPSASIPGRTYYTTDTQQIFLDNGTSWDNVTPAVPASVIEAIQQQAYVYADDTGGVNALVVSLSPSPIIAAGSLVVVKVAHSNTGASTIAVNGGSATAITKNGTTALTGGELNAGQIVFFTYDGTEYQLVGGATSGGGSGTVTSVSLTVPSRQSVSGSPVTSSGTLAITDNTQSANIVFAGPSSGSAAAPTFRALVSADLPLGTTSAAGALKPDGSTIDVSSGTISVPTATTSNLGLVKPDGSTITISGGVISASGSLTNPMTTEGDIIYGGTSGTPTRLAAGTSGNVLQTNGSGAAPTWVAPSGGGGYTKIQQIAPTTRPTSVTFTSILNTYSNLRLVISAQVDETGVGSNLMLQFNGDSGADYDYCYFQGGNIAPGAGAFAAQTSAQCGFINSDSVPSAFYASCGAIEIPNYANTAFWKSFVSQFTYQQTSTLGQMNAINFGGTWRSLAAISSITLIDAGAGGFNTGSVFTLYGEQ